jgi:hypothetical protein
MDQNWFYSTLAQSSSAIVGLFGALLFSYLLSVAKKLASDKDDLEEALRRWREEFIAAINISNIPEDATLQQRAALEGLDIVLKDFIGLKSSAEFKTFIESLQPQLQATPKRWSRNRSDFSYRNQRLLARFIRYETRVLPQSIRLLYFILMTMMIVGVIVPITQLSGFQAGIFILFSLSLLALFAWLGYEIMFVHPKKMRARIR